MIGPSVFRHSALRLERRSTSTLNVYNVINAMQPPNVHLEVISSTLTLHLQRRRT